MVSEIALLSICKFNNMNIIKFGLTRLVESYLFLVELNSVAGLNASRRSDLFHLIHELLNGLHDPAHDSVGPSRIMGPLKYL